MTTEIKVSDMQIGDKIVAIGWKCNMADYRQEFTVTNVIHYDPATSCRSPHVNPRVILRNKRGGWRTTSGSTINGDHARLLATDVYFIRAE